MKRRLDDGSILLVVIKKEAKSKEKEKEKMIRLAGVIILLPIIIFTQLSTLR